ncbi:hypothetical protein N825_34540 [Skermanella stibiiresistens SB22]|uniref:DUF2961 domain-containing protein n=1 Tax=Skermanella stibiiresistens SB22 TaxID=1385369 RepID=W9H7I8_9PROT|nr:DUF2961 domain-containing protein [Skermanella stibiiresistens]EWY40637.1 hypothetical protein N825_34540 [Skermanella stibiiresistens SB22]
MTRWAAAAALMAVLAAESPTARAADWPPPVPIGLDAYRQWERWPRQRIGVRAHMRSTYDREGGNRTADASHFLYGERPDFNVALDVLGRGVLYFVRTNHWHGSPWHYEIDGVDHVVRESSTADPEHPVAGSTFEPAEVFPPPLAWTWSTTMGADLNWVPMPFERSLRLAYGRTHYGTGYYIFHQFAEDTPLTSKLRSFDFGVAPDPAVLDLIGRSGTDIAPVGIATAAANPTLEAGKPLTLFRLDGPATVRALKLTVPRDRARELSGARLRVTWDGRSEPSVDAPLALFFGAGLLHNRTGAEYLVKAFPVGIRYAGDLVHLDCYFPMPFFRGATVELVPPDGLDSPVTVRAEIRHEPFRDKPSSVGYFHATYRDHGGGQPGKDHVLLDTRGIEGSAVWSGSFVGTSFTFTDRGELGTLEGDPRFFLDDAKSPQAHGTGTEEWGGGGDYWGGRTMTLPFAGHPIGAPTPAEAREPDDLVHSAYRFLLADLFPFGRNARIQLEHGGTNDLAERYRTVTYWYGLPAASLVRTDVLEIGDERSERAHGYVSPDATAPQAVTSRREGLTDDAPETRMARQTRGTSEFTLEVDPRNHGVMLRRTLDRAPPNQRAAVSVADGDAAEPVWEPAGTWYLAGSNTAYHSFPPGELDPPAPVIVTADRRLAEDEFILPSRLTRGRSKIRVRVAFEPIDRSLLPGLATAPSAWSEIAYEAHGWVEPGFDASR